MTTDTRGGTMRATTEGGEIEDGEECGEEEGECRTGSKITSVKGEQ